jgi:signal transduction histidine kinase
VRVDISGPPPILPAATSHHLRMIARESLANALKHARATRITLALSSEGGFLRLEVRDDGDGFDPSTETRGRAGHFGCVGMRERARKIGATIAWHSSPGTGTIVEVTMLEAENSALRGKPLPVPADADQRESRPLANP